MILVLLVLSVLVPWTMAQDPQTLHESELDAIQIIKEAQDEILLIAPSIYQQPLAEALREAIVVRGVDVYLLMSPDEVESRAAYVTSIQLAGARVRLTNITEAFMIVDRKQILSGASLAGFDNSFVDPVVHSLETGDVARAVSSFYEHFQKASIYTPAFLNTVRSKE